MTAACNGYIHLVLPRHHLVSVMLDHGLVLKCLMASNITLQEVITLFDY